MARPNDGALSVVLALTDASGSALRVEYDPRDGRAYLTVTFDGHEAPFEVTAAAAGTIAGALGRYAAPVDLSGLRFAGPGGAAVKQGKAARETGST